MALLRYDRAMKVWSALDGEPSIQLEVDDAPGQPFLEAVASRHRVIVGRALWSDDVMPHRWHYVAAPRAKRR